MSNIRTRAEYILCFAIPRALMTERCVTKIPSIKCRYADHGCQQPKMTLAQLEEHERDCEFRCVGTCVGACGGACVGRV